MRGLRGMYFRRLQAKARKGRSASGGAYLHWKLQRDTIRADCLFFESERAKRADRHGLFFLPGCGASCLRRLAVRSTGHGYRRRSGGDEHSGFSYYGVEGRHAFQGRRMPGFRRYRQWFRAGRGRGCHCIETPLPGTGGQRLHLRGNRRFRHKPGWLHQWNYGTQRRKPARIAARHLLQVRYRSRENHLYRNPWHRDPSRRSHRNRGIDKDV